MELLPLAVALAVCEACEAVAPVRCAVKWPNDVWIDGRKVAGILIEARPQEGWAVVGIGLNVDTAADELRRELRETATSLRIATGAPVDRDAALDALLDAARRLARRARPTRARCIDAFRERDALYGRRDRLDAAARSAMSGEARGIDDDGSLVVFTGDGEPVQPRRRRGPPRAPRSG